jgi:hypothetical protein
MKTEHAADKVMADGKLIEAAAYNCSSTTQQERKRVITEVINASITAERQNVVKARKGWEREVQRADDAEAAVGENCRMIERLEEQLADEREKHSYSRIHVDLAEARRDNEQLREQLAEIIKTVVDATFSTKYSLATRSTQNALPITRRLAAELEQKQLTVKMYLKASDERDQLRVTQQALVEALTLCLSAIRHEPGSSEMRACIKGDALIAKVKEGKYPLPDGRTQ